MVNIISNKSFKQELIVCKSKQKQQNHQQNASKNYSAIAKWQESPKFHCCIIKNICELSPIPRIFIILTEEKAGLIEKNCAL